MIILPLTKKGKYKSTSVTKEVKQTWGEGTIFGYSPYEVQRKAASEDDLDVSMDMPIRTWVMRS